MKTKVKSLGFIIGFVIIITTAWFFFHLTKQSVKPSLHSSVVFQVQSSASARKFTHFLKENHLIRCETCFLLRLRLKGLSTQLKAGFYRVAPGDSADQILQRVIRGEVMTEKFTIVEGTTWSHIEIHLKQAPYLEYTQDDVAGIQTAISQDGDNMALQIPTQSLEGLFLADTYQYIAGGHAKHMLLRAHRDLKTYLLQTWQNREATLPYHSPYELLIAASILEKESAITAERYMISGVIVNRLQKHMPLQMDPTVIYGLGSRYHGVLLHTDLQNDSRYNTYRYRGLPPTPIAMVGRGALEAAAHPEKTNNLYFVAKGDGTHVFSETYEAQRQAIQRYIRKNP